MKDGEEALWKQWFNSISEIREAEENPIQDLKSWLVQVVASDVIERTQYGLFLHEESNP